jgi:predicted unusual protein kinase regulating ubiquinone biosynthesis (AarF/ABC1/UbiB family)
MLKIFKNILFVFNFIQIIGEELMIYAIFRDYSSFVDRVTMRLSYINILYVKLFQAFALNNSLIDEDTNRKLLEFTDKAPWDYSDIKLGCLVEIAEKYDLYLKPGYEIPINAGMISLVFKAYKKDNRGEPVIIKMKRHNIQEKLNDAIDNFMFFIYLLSFIPSVNKYQLAKVIDNNIEIIRHQTNFLEEVDNMNRIKKNCKNLKYVKIPTAYREVTEKYPNCILMDYIEGIKVNQIEKEDYEGFAKQVIKFGFVTTTIHGFAHADLHAGNILFIKDEKDEKCKYKIGVIDFGIMYELTDDYKKGLFDVLMNLFEESPRNSAIKLINSGIIEPKGIIDQIPREDYENILDFCEEIIHETIYVSKKANQIQTYKFLSKIKDYLSSSKLDNIGIRPSDDFVKGQLVLAMSHGVTLKLCEDDYCSFYDKVMNELFHTDMII